MWVLKALSEDRLLVLHIVAMPIALGGMVLALVFGWTHMTPFWRVWRCAMLLLLLLSAGLYYYGVWRRRALYTTER